MTTRSVVDLTQPCDALSKVGNQQDLLLPVDLRTLVRVVAMRLWLNRYPKEQEAELISEDFSEGVGEVEIETSFVVQGRGGHHLHAI